MIFEELVIHNFGIYKGRHVIPLSPVSEKKPIVLFGGLNGGGKTTFLDALQLTLYGKFARCSNRSTMSYENYLRETINRHSPASEGAALELKFSSYIDGIKNSFQVKRYWKSTGKTVKENMEVIHNGKLDPVMTSQWYEYVEEFIPLSISALFFFDGEKIESLADPEGSAELIKTGIMSLLGLDVVEKLSADLKILSRNIAKSSKENDIDVKSQQLIADQESQINELSGRKRALQNNLASTLTSIDNYKNEIEKLKNRYRVIGGDLFDQREELIAHKNLLESETNQLKSELCKIAGGISPISLIENLLEESYEQAKSENEGYKIARFLEQCEDRDKKILNHLKSIKSDKNTISSIKDLIDTENNKLKALIPDDFYLGVPLDSFSIINIDSLSETQSSSKKLVDKIETLEEKILDTERKLSSIPTEDSIELVKQELVMCEDSLIQEKAKESVLNDQINLVSQQLLAADTKLINLKISGNKNSFNAEIDKRIDSNVNMVLDILAEFNGEMIAKHLSHLESLIYDSFISLIRKPELIKGVSINPENYQITLFDSNLVELPSNRLSAGERQILAISILWGLAKASGKPLPSIIDTPLGRLDSNHRKHLISNYFPKASHQVILLSTDQEIDKSYRDDLSKYIGREYHIEFQEKLQTSTISEGYF